MTAIISPADICNMALGHLKQRNRVNNITEPTTEIEVACALWWDVSRQALLREYVWRFAKKRVVINRTGTPAFDWDSAYKLPNDYIRFLSVNGEREWFQGTHYDIEGTDLLLNGNAASAKLRYVWDNDNIVSWDPLFKTMLSYYLALNLAYQFTLKDSVVERINKQLAIIEPKTATVNAQERPPIRIQRSKYLRARGGGSYSGGSYFTGPITDIGE